MTFRTKREMMRVRPRKKKAQGPTPEATGPHPSLIDVFKRHPEWRRRTVITLKAKIAGTVVPIFKNKNVIKYRKDKKLRGEINDECNAD